MGGPLADETGAMFVYAVASREEAQRLVQEDPYAEAGIFASFELSEWLVRRVNIDAFTDPEK